MTSFFIVTAAMLGAVMLWGVLVFTDRPFRALVTTRNGRRLAGLKRHASGILAGMAHTPEEAQLVRRSLLAEVNGAELGSCLSLKEAMRIRAAITVTTRGVVANVYLDEENSVEGDPEEQYYALRVSFLEFAQR